MKDFDTKRKERSDRDRSFKIGGETFVRRTGLRPEILLPWEKIGDDTPASEVLETIDLLVTDFIESGDDAVARYKALREREDDPVTLEDLQELVEWLVAEQTGRPTGPPSGSTPSGAPQGNGSTGASSLQVVEASKT